jgi:NAD(P)-dependent dehydrogenase (short-subunit alcohol dehydrogenase family)
MMQFEGKVVAVTGAGNGIGAATARLAAAKGALLSLCDIDESAVNQVAEELRGKGSKVLTRRVDVSSSEHVDSWIGETITQFGRLDCAANVAGVETKPGEKVFVNIVDINNEHWDYVMSINLRGMFYCLRAQLRVMERGASIMNVSSVAGVVGRPGIAAYSSSKHGIIGLSRTAAKEVGPRGIRVNALAPYVGTPLNP